MDKVRISNAINRLGCGEELLYCTRVYVNARIYGGAWIPMEKFLDTTFWLIRGQKFHCRAAYLYERMYHVKAKNQTDQVGASAQKTEAAGDKAS